MAGKSLTNIQKAFCDEYIIDLNSAKAARRAGYSSKTAHVKGSQLLAEPHIRERINQMMDTRSQRTKITADRVLEELARIAFVDHRNLVKVDADGNIVVKPSDELSVEDASCVAEISHGFTGVKIKLYDKINALEKLGKHLKLFTDVTETTHTFNQMGRVMVGDGGKGEMRALDFDVGQPANQLEKPKQGVIEHDPQDTE